MRKLPLLASTLFLAVIHFPVAAQDNDTGSLSVFWSSDLSVGRIITLSGDKEKIIKSFDWSGKKVPFFTTLVLPEHEYIIHLPGPIASVRLQTVKNAETFLQVAKYLTKNGDTGIQITSWVGAPNEAAQEAINSLKAGDPKSLEPTKLEPVGYSFYFNTEPPWDIPPRPPKPPYGCLPLNYREPPKPLRGLAGAFSRQAVSSSPTVQT
jgi:hypothetical protein